MRRIWTGGLAGLAAAGVVAGTVLTGAAPASAAANPPYQPDSYVDPFDSTLPVPITIVKTLGLKHVTAAFVIAGGGCTPVWDNGRAIGDGAARNFINSIRANGGTPSVSFGGYGGTKLGEACGSAAAVANAEQQVVNAYGLTSVDFDWEMPEWYDAAAIEREVAGAAILQANAAKAHKTLNISVTMPFQSTGDRYGRVQNIVHLAKKYNLRPNLWSAMVFNVAGPGANVVGNAIRDMDALHVLLRREYPAASDQAVYKVTGIVLMNGRSDNGEIYNMGTFDYLSRWARGHGLGRVSYWKLNRDRQCGGNPTTVQPNCSGVAQGVWQATKIIVARSR